MADSYNFYFFISPNDTLYDSFYYSFDVFKLLILTFDKENFRFGFSSE